MLRSPQFSFLDFCVRIHFTEFYKTQYLFIWMNCFSSNVSKVSLCVIFLNDIWIQSGWITNHQEKTQGMYRRSEGTNFPREGEGTGTVVNYLLSWRLFQVPWGPGSSNVQPHLFPGLRWIWVSASKDSPACVACCAYDRVFFCLYIPETCKWCTSGYDIIIISLYLNIYIKSISPLINKGKWEFTYSLKTLNL